MPRIKPASEAVQLSKELDRVAVGMLVRRLRKSKKLSLTRLAEMIGMNEPKLCRVEKGKCGVLDFVETITLCDALEITPDDFTRQYYKLRMSEEFKTCLMPVKRVSTVVKVLETV